MPFKTINIGCVHVFQSNYGHCCHIKSSGINVDYHIILDLIFFFSFFIILLLAQDLDHSKCVANIGWMNGW